MYRASRSLTIALLRVTVIRDLESNATNTHDRKERRTLKTVHHLHNQPFQWCHERWFNSAVRAQAWEE